MRNSEGGDAEVLRSRLRRFRRRALASGFLDAAPSCLALSLAIWIAGAFFLALHPPLMVFALAGLLAALVSAAVRLPSRLETARAVDRKAGLEQRLETAAELMEHVAEDDLVAALVLRDARRVTETLPKDVLPLRMGAGRATFCAFAILTFVLVMAAFVGREKGPGSLRLSPLGPIQGPVPESFAPMPDSGEAGPGAVGAAGSNQEDAADEVESESAESSKEPAPSESLSSAEPEELPGRTDSVHTPETPADSSGGEAWTAIASPLERDGDEDDAASPAGTGGPDATADRGAEGGPGESVGESRAAPFPTDVPPGRHYESPSPQGGIPPGLREYLREYFSKLRKAR
jgi:hypothetical protein